MGLMGIGDIIPNGLNAVNYLRKRLKNQSHLFDGREGLKFIEVHFEKSLILVKKDEEELDDDDDDDDSRLIVDFGRTGDILAEYDDDFIDKERRQTIYGNCKMKSEDWFQRFTAVRKGRNEGFYGG